MPRFEFATYSERSFYEVEAESEEEARKLLDGDPEQFYTGRHHDCIEYELIDVLDEDGCATCKASIETRVTSCDECGHIDEEDSEDEDEEIPLDTPSLDTSLHDHEMNID